MNAKAMLCCFVLLLPLVLLFAVDSSVSTASMTIEAYNEVPTPNGIFNVKVSFLNGTNDQEGISGIGSTFDVSSRATNGQLSSFSKVFVVAIESNYKNGVELSFRFSPFVNQVHNDKTFPATYKISGESQWTYVNRWWSTYRFMLSFDSGTTSNSESTYETNEIEVSSGDVVIPVVCSVKGQYGSGSSYNDYNYETSGNGTISYLGTNSMTANIYGSLQIDSSVFASENFEPNVDYVSTVVISLEVK